MDISTSKVSRRHFITTTTLAVGTVAGASTFLSACGASGLNSGKTTLTVMYASNELTKEYIGEFEKLNPDIKIKFLEFDQTRLNAMLAGNTPPDFVRGLAVGSASISARGLAANLDAYLDKSSVLKKADLLDINNAWRWDGKQIGQGPYYGITKDWSQDNTTWYNQELLEQAKIPALSATEPITYDQLFDMATKLTVKEGNKTKVYGYGLQWGWGFSSALASMIIQQGGKIYNADSTQADFTTPEAKRALEWFVKFQQSGIGPSSLDPTPDGWDGPTFLAKRMAITGVGYWFGGNIVTASDAIKKNARFAPAPVMGPKRFSPSSAGVGAWIPEKSKNKDAAWKLMEYFMTGKPAHDRAKSGWGIPALKSLLPEMPREQPYQQQSYEAMQNELKYIGLLPDSPYAALSAGSPVFDKYVQQVSKKQISLESACQQITEEVNKQLKRGKDNLG